MNRRNFLQSAIAAITGLSIWPKKAKGLTTKDLEKAKKWFEENEVKELEKAKYNVWCSLQLNPEHMDIPGAKEWIREINKKMNTQEMEHRFCKEFNRKAVKLV